MSLYMSVIKAQLENLKEECSFLVGGCAKILEFSNYSVSEFEIKPLKKEEKELHKINQKLKNLYNYLCDAQEEIKKI